MSYPNSPRSFTHLTRRYVLLLLMWSASLASICIASGADPANRGTRSSNESIASKTKGQVKREGLLHFYMDKKKGKLWLETPPSDDPTGHVGEYLYVEGLRTGLGANDVGLDRNQIGPTRLVAFRKVGGRLIVEAVNLDYRALSDDPAERNAVRESFATSILWAGPIECEEDDGRVLVDFTSFIVRDAHNVVSRLKRTGQGDYRLDAGRSVVDFGQCLGFPDNIELEALLTYSTSKPGSQVRVTAPDAKSVTLSQHHSFIRVPNDGYTPREFDPRAASYPVSFLDYAADIDAPLRKRWISRHRLKKRDPNLPRSAPVEPIVYYVDSGVPEPIRSALLDGARWWNQAFEAAGYSNAFRVDVLPDGAHPLDVRYNVINWVHRSTRGWSYGGSVKDPRTGEIIKGHVLLGSLRVRQDRLLFEGILGTKKTGSGDADDPVELALARIRQLSAHEVGHTLGFTHNFAASTYADRASVMDYPAPKISLNEDGSFNTSGAYAVGIGEWDKVAVQYAYSDFPPGANERAELDKIIMTSIDKKMLFLSDADARPAGGAHPFANLWDNGTDPIAELRNVLSVRTRALSQFGENNIQTGRPMATLQEVFVPVYLHHRYQLEAAIKMIGGATYSYAIRGDRQPPLVPVEPDVQRAALDVVLNCLSPEVLSISDEILQRMPPRPFGYRNHRELFDGSTGLTFDPIAAAGVAADLVVKGLLHPQRCARLIDHHRRDSQKPALIEVLEQLIDRTFPDPTTLSPRNAEIQRAVQLVVVHRLISGSNHATTGNNVRAHFRQSLNGIRDRILNQSKGDAVHVAHVDFIDAQIIRAIDRPLEAQAPHPGAPKAPPGSPIGATTLMHYGTGDDEFCSFKSTYGCSSCDVP